MIIDCFTGETLSFQIFNFLHYIMKRKIKRVLLLLLAAALIYGIYYCYTSFPIISGYGAKNLCSCVFVGGRTLSSVQNEELADFPLSLGKFTVDFKDSSVTGTVFGFAKQKAIYRKGLGCTLVNEISEEELRKQNFMRPEPPIIKTDTIAWPYGERVSDSMPQNISKEKLTKAMDDAFADDVPDYKKVTRAVVVLYDGNLIAEKYAPGFNKNSKMLGWSMTKSITSTLIAMLVKEGKLDINKPAPVAEWRSSTDERHAITIKNLLQQSSGLDFVEDYSKSSDATKMLFQRKDMAAYTASRPLKDKPGSVFYYSSGNSNILSRIIRQTLGDKEYYNFIYDSLFYKIGMYSALQEPDGSGTIVGSSYTWATARDWARFGLLFYNNGIWNNESLLPDDWVKEATTPATSSIQKEYGYQWWLNGVQANNPSQRLFPDVPADMFRASGYGGQGVYIIPSKKLVIVRLGLHDIDDNVLLKEFIEAVN